MTIAELLARLKVTDPETWDYYIQFKVHENIYDEEALGYILQGCIQRAIQARGWAYQQFLYLDALGTKTAIVWNMGSAFESDGDSPAEAILSAYLLAISSDR